MRVMLEGDWDVVLDGAFNGVDVLAGANAGAIADAKDMGVNGLAGMTPPHVQHHIGGLAPDAGQRHKRGTGGGHLAAIVIDQNLAQLDDVLGLVAVKPYGLDMLGHRLKAQIEHLLRRVGDLSATATTRV